MRTIHAATVVKCLPSCSTTVMEVSFTEQTKKTPNYPSLVPKHALTMYMRTFVPFNDCRVLFFFCEEIQGRPCLCRIWIGCKWLENNKTRGALPAKANNERIAPHIRVN